MESQRVDEINIVAIATIAYRGFLCSREFTYELKDLRNKRSFVDTSLLRLDITFSDLNKHVIVSLKRSKIDHDHIRVDIIIVVIGTPTCPI
jgi:hypothetical protein